MSNEKRLSISCLFLILLAAAIFFFFLDKTTDIISAETLIEHAERSEYTCDSTDSPTSDSIDSDSTDSDSSSSASDSTDSGSSSSASDSTDSSSSSSASDSTDSSPSSSASESTDSGSSSSASDSTDSDSSSSTFDSTDSDSSSSASDSTDETAAPSDTSEKIPLHIYFNFYDSSSNDINHTIGLYSMEVSGTIHDNCIEAVINPWPGMFDYQEVTDFPQVLINYGDVSGREINISKECYYDAQNGIIQIPDVYQNTYLTVKCIMSERSAAYQMLIPDEYKIIKTKAPMMRSPATDTSEFEVLENSGNYITLAGDTSSYKAGDVIPVTNAYVQTLNKNEDASLYTQTGTSAYMGYKGETIGYAISFDCNSAPLFCSLGNPGGNRTGKFPIAYNTYTSIEYSSRNWIYARCITTDSNLFDGNPKFSSGKIYVTNKAADGTLTCWVELYLTGPKNENAQNVGMYFKVKPLELPSLTIYKKQFMTLTALPGARFSLWSYDGTSYSNRLGYFTDNLDGSYTFSDINIYASTDQKFLIKEEDAPPGFALPYVRSNDFDKADYDTYGGRTIQYTDGTWTSGFSSFTLFIDKEITEPTLTINKTIQKEDLLWAHGNPTFFFKIHGNDVDGNPHTWIRSISFNAQYVRMNTLKDGSITRSVTLTDIPRGNYLITELSVSRFTLTDVTAQTDNVFISKMNKLKKYEGITPIIALVRADLTEKAADVTFFNRKITWDKYSHNDIVINEFKLKTT